MSRFFSFFDSIFNTEIHVIPALGMAIVLGVGLGALFSFSYIQIGQADSQDLLMSQFGGIHTVSADLQMSDDPGLIMPRGPSLQAPAEPALKMPDKLIIVSLKEQTLTYMEGMIIAGNFKISSGLASTPTPPGEYTVLKKKPVVDYVGTNYRYMGTKWNLMFKAHAPLNYYIHGAPWHNNFGHPMSHGCINVSYDNMEGLYNWADEGTKIIIY